MADGPATTPDQTEAPKGKGFLSKFKKLVAPPPVERQASPPSKEALSGKMGKVMAELKKKDQELEGQLISEFGEGETKFIAFGQPLPIDEAKDLGNGEKKGKLGFKDFLIVAPDGFKILRIRDGYWGEPDAWQRANQPDKKDDYIRRDEDRVMTDVAHQLIRRGNAAFRESKYTQAYMQNYSLEGSGYSHSEKDYSLNFGKGPSLKFSENGYFQDPSRELRAYMGANRSLYGESADRGLEWIREDQAQLILNPDANEITEIMQLNIRETKAAKDIGDTQKLAEEARKLAEAKEAQKPEKEKLKTEEAKRLEAERQAVSQTQSADSALDLLNKL